MFHCFLFNFTCYRFKSYIFSSSIWYELSKGGIFQGLKTKPLFERIDSDGTLIENKKEIQLKCSCGHEMERIIPIACYVQGAECNECHNHIGVTSYMYHCPMGRNAAHPDTVGGYDYCLDCAKEKWNQRSRKNSIDNSVTTTVTATETAAIVTEAEKAKETIKEAAVGTMYHKLVEISDKNLAVQVDFLKNSIDKIMDNKENKEEREAFEKMIDVKEKMICDPVIGVRQDTAVDIETGEELLKFPNNTAYDRQTLQKIQLSMPSNSNFNVLDHFDANSYLGTLIVTAYSLNPMFHETMKNIFGLTDNEIKNDKLKVIYGQGPVKTIERAQAKAETGMCIV